MTPMAVRTREGSTPDNVNEVARSSGPRHDALGLSLDDVKRMYRLMLMTRLVSERILQLNRMGRTPFGAGTDGHEAAQVGAAWCIRPGKDWTVPYYRDMGVSFVLGFTALDEFRAVLGKATDTNSAGRAMLNMFSSPERRGRSPGRGQRPGAGRAEGLPLPAAYVRRRRQPLPDQAGGRGVEGPRPGEAGTRVPPRRGRKRAGPRGDPRGARERDREGHRAGGGRA